MNMVLTQMLVTLLVTAFTLAQPAVQEQKTIRGVYNVFCGEKQVQTDQFEYNVGDKSRDEVTIAEGKEGQRYDVGYDRNGAQYFHMSVNGISKMRATLEGDIISFHEGEAMVGALPAETHLMMIEPAAYSEFAFLLNAYDLIKGGKQQFQVIIPSQQDFVNMDVEKHGWDNLTLDGKSIMAVHYRIAIGKKEAANLWTDRERIVSLYFASKSFYVIDGAYPTLYDQVKKIVNKAM